MSQATFRLLFADDEFWVRENLKNLVDWQELMITLSEPAVDGEDAIRRIEAERPDILITDINMPFVTGNELIRFAKERYPHMAIIVLSGYSDFAFVRDALLCGAVDYLLKPVSKTALLNVLEKAIAVLSGSRALEREKAELNENLLRASSILRDREMSSLIAEDEPAPEAVISDLELTFATFTLVLVRLIRLRSASGNLNGGASRQAQEIKNLISKSTHGSVVFHNVYARNEYILLTDLRPEELTHLCQQLPERLERYTGVRWNVAVSRSYYSFAQVRSAYQEAHSALMARPMSQESAVVRVEDARKLSVRERITPEQENRFFFALQSKNKKLAREVIFDQVGLGSCVRDHWLFAEVKETAEYLAAIIFHHAESNATSRAILAMENFTYLLDAALESQDVPEMCSLLEQLLDEAFDDPGAGGVSTSMKSTIRSVQAYIDERYFANLSLTSLAKLFRVERSYLSKAFKQVTGFNLMLAIAKKRIEKAEEYIRGEDPNQRDLSLADISYLVGYEEYAYFNRVFRKIAGLSPSAYKAVVQEGARK